MDGVELVLRSKKAMERVSEMQQNTQDIKAYLYSVLATLSGPPIRCEEGAGRLEGWGMVLVWEKIMV